MEIDKEYKSRGGNYKMEIVYYTINGEKVEQLFKNMKEKQTN